MNSEPQILELPVGQGLSTQTYSTPDITAIVGLAHQPQDAGVINGVMRKRTLMARAGLHPQKDMRNRSGAGVITLRWLNTYPGKLWVGAPRLCVDTLLKKSRLAHAQK